MTDCRAIVRAAMVPFDPQRALQIKKDLESFVKNRDLIDTEEKHTRLQKAIRTWDAPLRKEYNNLMKSLYDIAFEQAKDGKGVDRQIEVWRKKLAPLSRAHTVVSLPSWEYWSTEFETRRNWAEQVEKVIRQLPDVAKFLEGLRKRRKIVPEVSVLTEQQMNLRGFPAKAIGLDTDNAEHMDSLGRIEKAIDIYRSRAPKVSSRLPKSVPLTLRFDVQGSLGGALGSGGASGIELYPNNARNQKPVEIAKTIAHEMGHYVYGSVLSTQDQAFWRKVIQGDLGNLDLRDLLKQWPGNESIYGWAKKVQKSDPVLSLQLMTLMTPSSRLIPAKLNEKWHTLDDKDGIEAYLRDGGDPVIKMPQTPISGYATTNPEEAFCEALGFLVAYGPRTVHPKVVSWMKMILPGMKAATSLVRRVVDRSGHKERDMTAAEKIVARYLNASAIQLKKYDGDLWTDSEWQIQGVKFYEGKGKDRKIVKKFRVTNLVKRNVHQETFGTFDEAKAYVEKKGKGKVYIV